MRNKIKNFSYPLLQLKSWLDKAKNSYSDLKLDNYNAAVLSTVSKNCKPSSRIVLIKDISSDSVVFYTNLNSRKAKEIAENNYVSLVLYWEVLKKQIRIEGVASIISNDEADNYFKTRPYLSKIGAWASKQSQIMENESDLNKRVNEYSEKYKEDVPRPHFWSGFKVDPSYLEFWENMDFRLHKRITYKKTKDGFKETLLYP